MSDDIRLSMTTVNAPDALALATFYAELTGGTTKGSEHWATVSGPNGCIAFHDAQITYNGIADCLDYLKQNGIKFRAYVLPHIVFVVEIGDSPLHENAGIRERLLNNHEAYLFSLQNNDHFRQFSNKLPFRVARNFISRLRKGNVSQ